MSSIRNQMLQGIKWTSVSTFVITVIQIIQFGFLANRLSVAEFGLVGILTTCIMFAQIVLDLGIGSAVIQKEKVSSDTLSTLYWLNILTGLIIFAFLMFGSPFIATFFHRSELVNLIRILAFIFLIAPIGMQSQYLLQKDLRFQELGMIETVSTIISFVSLLILIFIIQPILAYTLSQLILYGLKGCLYFLSYRKTWQPSFVFYLKDCKDFFSFGTFQLLSRIVNRIGSSMDVLLIGRFMGSEALGIYNLVYQIVTIPVLKINPIVTRVAFPVFAKNQQNKGALNEGFLHMTELLSLVSFPILIGLVAVSKGFILTFFGPKWVGAASIMQIMSFVGILRVLMNPNGSVLLAKGKANVAFYWDLGVLFLYGGSLFIAVQSNQISVVAWTYVLISFLNFFIGRWLLAWLIELRWTDYLRAILTPLVFSFLMAVAVYLVNKGVAYYAQKNFHWALIASIGVGAIIYIMLLRWKYPQFFLLSRKEVHG